MKIRVTKGRADLRRSRWFLSGEEKIGKSILASGWPNALFGATEQRHNHIKDAHVVDLVDWNKYKGDDGRTNCIDFVKQLQSRSFQKEYNTIVIDVVDLTYEWCVIDVCKDRKIEHRSDEGFGKGYDIVDQEYKKWFYELLSLPYGLIFISHTKIVEVNTMHGTKSKLISTLSDRARRIIYPHMGVICMMHYDLVDTSKGAEKSKFINKRVLSFGGNEYLEAGDGEGYLPKRIVCYKDPRDTFDEIEDYYEGRKIK